MANTELERDQVQSIAGSDSINGEDENSIDETSLEVPVERRRVKTDKRDLPVETLYTWVKQSRLELQPEFQREFVWSTVKASRLIESLLLNIPIPVIYVAEDTDGRLEVVDGQQRLTSISCYVDQRLPDGKEFRLSGLQVLTELNGKTFKQLDRKLQTGFWATTLRLIVIEQDSDPDVKFEIFERLNLGAEKLNDQELRNCVCRGTYNDLLHGLASDATLQKILGTTSTHKRMLDQQMILRFLAMWRNTHLKYKAPMKQFLNREMRAYRNAPAPEIARMKEIFESAIDLAYTVFGRNAFRRFTPGSGTDPNGRWETKLNLALWDTLLYTFTFYEKRVIVSKADAIREEFIDLSTNDPIFSEYITSTTDKPDRIRYRADQWKRRMDNILDSVPRAPRCFSLQLKESLFDDDPTCGICSQRIQDIDDAEVDHIEHYWRGGKTIPENARLTHRFCNRSRGGKEDEPEQ